MPLEFSNTCRGFRKIKFSDDYALQCSLQESSIDRPGGCIWIGLENPAVQYGPRLISALPLIQKAADEANIAMGAATPGDVLMDGRMHLTREMAADLIPVLQYFVQTGHLPDAVEENQNEVPNKENK